MPRQGCGLGSSFFLQTARRKRMKEEEKGEKGRKKGRKEREKGRRNGGERERKRKNKKSHLVGGIPETFSQN